MKFFEKLYDEYEKVKVRFVGFATDQTRYDFGIVYTSMFFGKPLFVCMQTGRSALLDPRDLEDTDYLMKTFRIQDEQQVADLVEFFQEALPSTPFEPQYD
ncbi:DUF3055 domain-containing protein [Bacillus methanolicus]|uniref:DUF3055 domain-containing protein n=1 Tax=Bacillus methanolicus (strain MGA3 / ATCC 53907) TaxID=796606 RepID=I3DYU8_BACMM|nr:DUF3055 domain-containing protein [Bacillus methanolicus]AIE59495.1 hypothetical protein BMMGA3_05325 [Bacillus methanolicus MGA3]EIJ79419.1 hypothetical protein MGA3_13726 [Bacillus methanolicus MGA3]UQD51557.1 DUF3055 domain-containing protein [Bacillus methanolicus]